MNSVGRVSIVAVVLIAFVIVSDAVASAANIVDNLLWPLSLLLFEMTM